MIAEHTLPSDYSPSPTLLAGRVVLVTGAGQGLGRAAALAFARHGASLILHGRNLAKLEQVQDQIEALASTKTALMPFDFLQTSQTELDGFAHTLHKTFRRLDGIFHAASHFSPLTPLALQPLESWQRHWQVNVAVPAALTRACLPMLLRAPDAAVVFLTETHAMQPKPFWGAFALAKGALSALPQIWSGELPEGCALRFHVCLPGPVASPMRFTSHPAEIAEKLPTANSLDRHFLYLMGEDGKAARNAVLRCHD